MSVDELVATAPGAGVDGGGSPAIEGEAGPQDGAGDGIQGLGDEPVTILAPDAATEPAPGFTQADPPQAVAARDGSAGIATAGEPAMVDPPPVTALGRRPTKFLADLTRAMQAAAEQARTATLEQFRADGTAVIEQIHARFATGATELRSRADDDVAAIKDWSKAEIARIREETEQRVGGRRGQLEGQLERHTALVEHEIEKVRGRIATFETEMGRFFDDLVSEDDPAAFAARAASLPEPPSFEDLDSDAMKALLCEPGVGVPGAVIETVEAVDVAETVEVAEQPVAETVPVVIEPPADGAVDVVEHDAQGSPDPLAEDALPDREAAMAAIQAAAEAAAALEIAEDEAESTPDATTADSPDGATQDPGLDPRLAMLGLGRDFAAAELAAVEMAAAEIDDLPEMGDDAVAARLSGLVRGGAPAGVETAVTTRVMVTGLVSVASIASFKRHLGRLAGVGHVGVSSGPDAEFVFAVSHEPATSLRDLIPSIPGFAARVVGYGDGIIQVSAQDPQD